MEHYTWKTRVVLKETIDTVTICFDTQETVFDHAPGQFINVALNINGNRITRAYSLSSKPGDPSPAITVKMVDEGLASSYLFQNAHEITDWDIEGPFGNFILKPKVASERQVIFLGGGSGITPLFSMIKSMDNAAISPALIYANRHWSNIIFKERLEELKKNKKISIFHALSAPQLDNGDLPTDFVKGRLSRLVIKKLIKQITTEPISAFYYICGPEQLMQLYQEAVEGLGVPAENIHSENFYPKAGSEHQLIFPTEAIDVVANYYDSERDYETTCLITVQPGQNLLAATLENGIPVKNSCQSGSYGACWARHVSGRIVMLNNYALTEEEVEKRVILLCQTYALDNDVTIDIG